MESKVLQISCAVVVVLGCGEAASVGMLAQDQPVRLNEIPPTAEIVFQQAGHIPCDGSDWR